MKYSDYTGGQVEAVINRMGGMGNWLRFAGGHGRIVFDSILFLFTTVKVSAQPAVTTSEKYFEEAGVKWMEGNFESQFLDLEVEAVEETTLSIHKLNENSLDEPILQELGDKAEINPSQFKEFLSKGEKSQAWFIFYLKGKNGELWAVRARWNADDDGWDVSAYSVRDSSRWVAGSPVVSRK